MNLGTYGWQTYVQKIGYPDGLPLSSVARVIAEHRGGYRLISEGGELAGVLRKGDYYRSSGRKAELPKVGDWVVFDKLPGEQKGVITQVLPRASKLARVGVGKEQDEQVLAANVDLVLVVQSLDQDFNLRRLERYLALAQQGEVQAVVVLNKADAVEDVDRYVQQVREVAGYAGIYVTSATEGTGISELEALIGPGETVAFLGSSGVGKSTLINRLLGTERQKTGAVRAIDQKGRHTTSRRELLVLPGGGVLVDTPGMRELQLSVSDGALQATFEDVSEFAASCRFRDCDHEKTEGCAVVAAVQSGRLPEARYESFLKLKKEAEFIRSKQNKQAFRDRQKRFKRIQKEYKKIVGGKRGEW